MIGAARFTNKSRQNVISEKKKSDKPQKGQRRSSSLQQNSVFAKSTKGSSLHTSWNETSSIPLSVSPFQTAACSGSISNHRHNRANRWGLVYHQTLALKVTWGKLCEAPHSTCRGTLQKNQGLREIFYNAAFVNGIARHRTIATLHDHSHFFISLISQVIQSLNSESDEILEHVNKIGLCHSDLQKYGFRQTLWDSLGEELVDALVVQNCVRSFPGSCRAWTILIATLTDHLRAATISSYSTSNLTRSRYRSKLSAASTSNQNRSRSGCGELNPRNYINNFRVMKEKMK
uniref:Globin family profile domain-containing protein n=1 Tax=Setaria digitata TaxID=48799 RepID=A0A915PJB5_9BILA